jgi:hypothetical protein
MDAAFGGLLMGNGKGAFQWVTPLESGLAVPGDIRAIIQLKDKILFGVVGAPVKAFAIKK